MRLKEIFERKNEVLDIIFDFTITEQGDLDWYSELVNSLSKEDFLKTISKYRLYFLLPLEDVGDVHNNNISYIGLDKYLIRKDGKNMIIKEDLEVLMEFTEDYGFSGEIINGDIFMVGDYLMKHNNEGLEILCKSNFINNYGKYVFVGFS
jgi:hypothetical protein